MFPFGEPTNDSMIASVIDGKRAWMLMNMNN